MLFAFSLGLDDTQYCAFAELEAMLWDYGYYYYFINTSLDNGTESAGYVACGTA